MLLVDAELGGREEENLSLQTRDPGVWMLTLVDRSVVQDSKRGSEKALAPQPFENEVRTLKAHLNIVPSFAPGLKQDETR